MADAAGIPRSRGALSGLLLILLGAWGALVPFVGPYFHFAYTPDVALKYTTGRLWLEVAPGAAAAAGGLIVLITRSRALGGLAAFLAALGGAWFITGTAITAQFLNDPAITPGSPVGTTTLHRFLVGMGFFVATGVLILFFAALALGRFSAGGDAARDWSGGLGSAGGQDSFPAGPDQYQTQEQYPAGSDQYSATGTFPQSAVSSPATQDTSAAPQDLFGRSQQQYSSPAGQFPPPSASPFPATPSPFTTPGSPGSGSTES